MNSYNTPAIIRYALTCVICLGAAFCQAFGQRHLEEAIPYRNTISIRSAGGFIEADFTRKEYIGKAGPRQIYHSYYRDSIYATQGGYHGHPLHGKYIERYADKGLKVLGNYTYGLRSGKWQHWDEGGVLRKVSRWKEGNETGRFAIYDVAGSLKQRGYFVDGKFDGIVSTYQTGDSTSQREQKRYRLGKVIGQDGGSWFGRMHDKIRSWFW